MKVVWKCSIALVTMFGLSNFATDVPAGGFTEFVKGQVRQQLNTPQQTPITKTIRGTKKVATVVVNKTYNAMFDHAVQAGKKK